MMKLEAGRPADLTGRLEKEVALPGITLTKKTGRYFLKKVPPRPLLKNFY
jgi:hypothetical protein